MDKKDTPLLYQLLDKHSCSQQIEESKKNISEVKKKETTKIEREGEIDENDIFMMDSLGVDISVESETLEQFDYFEEVEIVN